MGVVNYAAESLEICRSRDRKQKFTTADTPQFNGVAEHALGLNDTFEMAGQIQARELAFSRSAIAGN